MTSGSGKGDRSDWHSFQDQQITDAVEDAEQLYSDPSAINRIFALCNDLSTQRNLMNVGLRHGRADRFSVMDVGCGPGRLLSALGMNYPNAELFGTDTNEASVALARRNVPGARVDLAEFGAIRGVYDVVVCSQVYEHVINPPALLDALVRITKPGGIIVFSMPSGWIYRRPRLGNFVNALRDWGFYRRVRLQPERNWAEALPHHPSMQPSKVIRQFRERGGVVLARSSSMWMIRYQGPLVRFCRLFGEIKGAVLFNGFMMLFEGAMNIFPPLRIFEICFVLAVEKPRKPVSA